MHTFLFGTTSHVLSLQSKRFEYSTEAIPGPGTYNLSKHSDWIKQLPQKQLYEEEVRKKNDWYRPFHLEI